MSLRGDHQMKVYVFGNEDIAEDKVAIEVARELEGAIEGISFVFVNPNEDVPFVNERHVVILDTVEGIQDVALVEGDKIDGLILSPRGSVHDFDLAFQLRYLKKLGKLGKVTIIGIPQEGEIDHLRIQSILRKLVAHDMQGS
jgi:Ni,Fe-hydrogenase maturation factor